MKTFKIQDTKLAQMINGVLCHKNVNFKTTVFVDGSTEFEFSETEITKVLKVDETWDFTS